MTENILKIPDGTIKIEAGAYKGQAYTHIEFPSSLREIGESAFEECGQIRYLKLPSGLTKIGAKAFYACTSLGEVFIPESVIEIGEDTFSQFGLIYCETQNPFPEGWYYDCKEFPCESGEQTDRREEKICCAEFHTWCGNYKCEITHDAFLADDKALMLDPMRKCLFGRKEKYVHILQGVFYYDLTKHLLDLGEENLRRGIIPNMNPVMKLLQQNLKDSMEKRLLTAQEILQWIVLYTETAADSFGDLRHNEEGAFILWGMAQYVWQLVQISDCTDRYQEIERIVLQQRKELRSILVSFDETWETILDLLEHVDLTRSKLLAWIKAYYEKKEIWREERIFSAYHEMYFGKNRDFSDNTEQNGESYYNQAVKLIGQKEYDEGGKLFGKAARCGHAAGQFNYAISLINGEGCEVNPLEGCYWYREAALQGHSKAMMNLAICYRNGIGVLQSGIKMMEWYTKAANCLLPEAVYNLGLSLKHEEVIRGNAELGITLIKAAEDVEEYTATQEFVKRVTMIILEALEKFHTESKE